MPESKEKSKPKLSRFLAVTLAASALAVFSFGTAVGSITESKNPELAELVSPTDGFALANAGSRLAASELAGQDKNSSDLEKERIAAYATRAFIKEPLSLASIRNLGLLADDRGDQNQARELMRFANSLSKRDVTTNLWLIKDYGRLSNTDKILEKYDQSLRSSQQGRQLLLPILQNGLTYGEIIDPLAGLLETSPPWADDFWANLSDYTDSLPNAALLRTKLANAGHSINPVYDQRLLNALLRQQNYSTADNLFSSVEPDNEKSQGNILRNGSFDVNPSLVPFAWETFSGDQYDGIINPAEGVLEIYNYGSENDIIARQIFESQAGRYRLKANFLEWSPEYKDTAYLKIKCANAAKNDPQSIRIDLNQKSTVANFEIGDLPCEYLWIEVLTDAQPTQQDVMLKLADLLIEPV